MSERYAFRATFGPLLTLVLLLVAAHPLRAQVNVRQSLSASNEPSILAFDLRTDSKIESYLFLDLAAIKVPTQTILLPFESSAAESSLEYLSSWASYPGFTILRFYFDSHSDPKLFLQVTPKPISFDDLHPDLASLPNGGLFIAKKGLTRHFIYKYPDSQAMSDEWKTLSSRLPSIPIETIALLLPEHVDEIAIREGKAEIPSAKKASDSIKYFPGNESTSQQHALEVQYSIQPSAAQSEVNTFLIAAVGVLVAAILQLWLTNAEEVKRPKTRITVIVCLAIVLFLFFAYLVYSLFVTWNSSSSFKNILDLVLALFAGISSSLPLWIKFLKRSTV